MWLFGFGGSDDLARWAAEGQRTAQSAMAGGLRGLKGGEAGAFAALMGVCFGYGFFHAIGPGHGKVLIGGVGLAGRGTATRLAVLAALASLGQAVTAIVLVWAGIRLLGWTREALTGAAEALFAPASWAAIGLIGLWLVIRATRRLLRAGRTGEHHDHEAGACHHHHAPTPDQAARAGSLREAAALVAAIAIRPCTGALFLLVITHAMGLFTAGMAGTVAMALGTASVTVLVAVLAVTLRGALFLRLAGAAGSPAAIRWAALAEGGAGALIAAVAMSLLIPAL